MEKLNTHYYDGKIKQKYLTIKSSFNQQPLDLETSLHEIEELIGKNIKNEKIKQQTLRMLNLFKGTSGNYDRANDIDARELIRYVWTRVREYDSSGQQLFLEQLREIKNGTCPQGRTTRLIQLIE